MENLENTREFPKQYVLTGKIFFSKKGAIIQVVGHVMWAMHQSLTNWP